SCGRLRCCLQYELEFYKERMQEFPRLGSSFRSSRGAGMIADVDIFQETVRLRFHDGDEETVSLTEFGELCQGSASIETAGDPADENPLTTDSIESAAEDNLIKQDIEPVDEDPPQTGEEPE
ncbi:hypothetical protein H8D51_01060, partial [bacterium]|nr:hypothetical protein [bacterium]